MHVIRTGEPELRLLLPLMGERGRLVDVGSNDGPYSFVACAAGRRVVAFEPNPVVAARLRKDLGSTSQVHEVALSDRSGTSAFFIPFEGETVITTRGALDPEVHSRYEQRRIDVAVATLDSFDLIDVAVIKVDVEGHEREVLAGALHTLEREKPNLVIEIEDHRAPGNLSVITGMLHELGYSGFYLLGSTLMPVQSFDLATHQSPEHAPAFGERRDAKLYVNNFIWLSSS